jgi:hypothetical protein
MSSLLTAARPSKPDALMMTSVTLRFHLTTLPRKYAHAYTDIMILGRATR